MQQQTNLGRRRMEKPKIFHLSNNICVRLIPSSLPRKPHLSFPFPYFLPPCCYHHHHYNIMSPLLPLVAIICKQHQLEFGIWKWNRPYSIISSIINYAKLLVTNTTKFSWWLLQIHPFPRVYNNIPNAPHCNYHPHVLLNIHIPSPSTLSSSPPKCLL